MSNRKRLTALDDRRKDKALPFLTVQQADRVRALMREAFAERGLEVTVFDDHLRAADGREFGLWNVASRCHGAGRSESAWRPVISDHVDKLMAGFAAGDPFEGLSEEDLRARTYTRLWERDVDARGARRTTRPSSSCRALLEVITLRIPDGVAPFTSTGSRSIGGWDRLHDLGRANLAACEPKERRVHDHQGGRDLRRGSRRVDVHREPGPADARLRRPGRASARAPRDGPADEGLGWLLAVPNRHELAWHTIRDERRDFRLGRHDAVRTDGPRRLTGTAVAARLLVVRQGYRQVTSYHRGRPHPGVSTASLLRRGWRQVA